MRYAQGLHLLLSSLCCDLRSLSELEHMRVPHEKLARVVTVSNVICRCVDNFKLLAEKQRDEAADDDGAESGRGGSARKNDGVMMCVLAHFRASVTCQSFHTSCLACLSFLLF